MAYSESTTIITLPAAADLSARQYHFVIVDGNGQAALSAADQNAIGILQNKPDAQGRAASVLISGASKLVCGGAGSGTRAGYNIGTDANGRGVEKSSASDPTLGIVLETATNAGEIATVVFSPNGVLA
jgi:hypothetical protein